MDRTSLLYSNNGTPHLINIESASPVAESIMIIICYFFGVGYNLIIIVTVLSNDKLRTSSFYILLMEVCITCFLDCLTNESIAFGYLLNNGSIWCGFSAIVFHLFLLVHSLSLGLLLLERTLSLKDNLLNIRIALGAVLTTWVFSLVFVSPTVGFMEVNYFPNRNACGAVKTNKWFSILSLLGFLLVWSFMAVCVYELLCYIKKCHSERKQLNILSIFPSSSTSSEIQNSVLPEIPCSNIKTACTIVFIYIVLMVPMVISFIVTLFLLPTLEPDPWIDPRVPTNKTRTILTHSLEPLFAYSRYMYNALVPILILSSDRDIRTQSRQVFCSRRNVISNFDQGQTSPKDTVKHRMTTTVSTCSLSTPVLFATSTGIHLRSTLNIQARFWDSASVSKSKLRLLTTFCDLTINSVNIERSISDLSQTLKVGEGHLKDKRCVRFSSQVDAISAPESRLSIWSSADNASQSNHTQTITPNVFVKSGIQNSNNVGNTYTKM